MFSSCVNHLHTDDLIPAVFEARNDLSDEVTLDTIGLDHDETAFSIRRSVRHWLFCFACQKGREMEGVAHFGWQAG